MICFNYFCLFYFIAIMILFFFLVDSNSNVLHFNQNCIPKMHMIIFIIIFNQKRKKYLLNLFP